MEEIKEISRLVCQMKSQGEVFKFFLEILTKSELVTLSKRWRILSMLAEGRTQRNIANELNVSLCKVTRGAKILKDQSSVINKLLNFDRGTNYGKNF